MSAARSGARRRPRDRGARGARSPATSALVLYRSFAPSKRPLESATLSPSAGASVTLASAIEAIAADGAMTKGMKKFACSGLRAFARLIHLSPEAIPLTASAIRPSLRDLTTAKTGLSIGYLQDIVWALGYALRRFAGGEGVRPRRSILSSPFAELSSTVEDRWDRIALGPFFSFCTRVGIGPSDVTSEALRDFRRHLVQATLIPNPAFTANEARLAWNKCRRRYPQWPREELAPEAAPPSGPALSEAFRQDLQSYAAYLTGERPHWSTGAFLERPLRQSAVATHVAQIRRCASAAACEGTTVCAIGDLGDAKVLGAIRSRLDGAKPGLSNSYVQQAIGATALAAKRWSLKRVVLRDPPALAARIPETSPRKFQQCIDVIESGSLPHLLALPRKLLARALEFEPGDHRRLAAAQSALGLEIMLMAPVSSIQVVTIRGRDFRCGDARAEPIPSAVLKVRHLTRPSLSIEYELPERSVALYRSYRRCMRLATEEDPDGWLFPGRTGTHRTADGFGELIGEKIWKHVGLTVTPRSLRFLAGTLYLLRHPDGHEAVRQGMRHRQIAHTRRMFSLVRIANSFKKFDELLGPASRRDDRG